ncbi:binary toxin-like calcium binding domain-containing protein, partial [Bacillus solimangrovi]|uniref:binary toxin-like calcium binding domain-containing protein n=1 Tax=Bacillus solimangrovi TaxID=1305675 RepID=UPI00316AC9F6
QAEGEVTEPTEEQAEGEVTEPTEEQAEDEVTEPTEEVEVTENQEETNTLTKRVSKSGLIGSITELSDLVAVNSSSPSGVDFDGDNIPNTWEIEGYTLLLDGLVKWEDEDVDEYGEGAIKYVTSPYSRSTDEDPYSDFQEVMSLVDKAIAPVAQHPLVAAFPDIQAEIEGVTITPIETITTTDGTVLTEAWSDSLDKSKTTASSLGYKAGFELGFENSVGFADTGVKYTGKFYGESNGQWDKSKTKTTSRVDSEQDTTSWSQATTSNPSEAAKSVWNVKYTNKELLQPIILPLACHYRLVIKRRSQ